MHGRICALALLATSTLLAQAPNLAPMEGKATDVAVGTSGVLWAIGTDAVPGGKSILRWNGTAWDTIPGGATRIAVDPQGAAWIVRDTGTISRWSGAAWDTVPGAASDIGIGADGTVWALGTDGTPQRWTGTEWKPVQGRGTAIAVGPRGAPWVVGATGEPFRFDLATSTWIKLPGKAKDIAVAGDGTGFIVGAPNGKVFRFDGTQWVPVPGAGGGAERVAAGAKGTLLVARDASSERALLWRGTWTAVASAPIAPPIAPPGATPTPGTPPAPAPPGATPTPGTPPAPAPPGATPTPGTPPAPAPPTAAPTPIVVPAGSWPPVPPAVAPLPVQEITIVPPLTWSPLQGGVTDVAVGANGVLWAIGSSPVPGGYNILRWIGSAWETIPGGALRIAVDPAGMAWVINDTHTIFRWRDNRWATMPGAATDVGIGADGTVWVIGGGGTPYRWTGTSWASIGGGGSEIAVGPQGEPWLVNTAGDIYRYTLPSGPWELLPGKAKDIAVAADGTAFVVGTGPGIVHRFVGKNWVPDAAGTTASRIGAGPAGTVVVAKDGSALVAGTVTAAQPTSIVIPTQIALPVIPPPVLQPPTGTPPAPAPAPAPPPLVLPTGPIVITGNSGIDPKVPPPSGPGGGSIINGTLVAGAQPPAVGADPNERIVVSGGPVSMGPGIIAGHMVCSDGGDGNTYRCGKVKPLDLGPYRVAVPTDCPSGSFWDGYFGGTCWKCQGDRTTDKIDSPDACAHEKLYRATRVASAATAFTCPAHSFWDGYNGGACYHCGDGNRTAYHIDSDQSCSILEHTPAEFVKNVGCTEHASWEIGKPRPYTDVVKGKCFACPVIDKDTGDVLIAEDDPFSDDCQVKVRWAPTQVLTKRITGSDQTGQLLGSGDLVREILAEPEQITAYLKFAAAEAQTPPAAVPAFVDESWASIASNPNENPLIKALLLERTLEALALPKAQRSDAEQRVLDSFQAYAQSKREAVPGDALAMYRAWKRDVDALRASRKTNLGDLLYYGTVPLDFDTAAQAVATGGSLAMGSAGIASSLAVFKANTVVQLSKGFQVTRAVQSGAQGGGQILGRTGVLTEVTTKTGETVMRVKNVQQVATSAARAVEYTKEVKQIRSVYNGLDASFKAVRNLIRVGAVADDVAKGGEVVAAGARAASAGARTAQEAVEIAQGVRAGVTGARAAVTGASAAAAGAAVITIVFGILLDIAIDQVVAIETAEPTLQAKFDAAKVPVSLESMLAAKDGASQLTLLWSSMVEGKNGPDPQLTPLAAAAAGAAKAAGYPTGIVYTSVTGKATDIARGEDGSTWIIGDGGTIQRRAAVDTAWTTVPGGATRISVGRGDDAWVVNGDGDVYAWQNGSWSYVCGSGAPCNGLAPAADIAVSATGAVWAINRAGEIYRNDATGWFRVPAPVAAARIDAAGQGLAAIVGTDGKLYVLLKDAWVDPAAPAVTDVALDETGQMYVIWREGGLSYLPPGDTTWQGVSLEGPFTAVAAGNHPAVTGGGGIRIADRGFVVSPQTATASSAPAAPVDPVPMRVSLPGMPNGEIASVFSVDPTRRTLKAKTRGGVDIVTVIVADPALFSTASSSRRIWVDKDTGKASLDGKTVCCPATFQDGIDR